MQKVWKGLVSFGLAIAMCFSITAVAHTVSAEYVLADAAEGSYYSSLKATGGDALLGELHDLITTTHTKYTSYNDIKTYASTTDPGLDGKGVLEFYTHETVTSFSGTVGTWNREHVWCQSLSNGLWGTSGGGSDMHHIRPTESSLNGTRGNDKYGKVSNGSPAYSKKVGGAISELGGYSGGGTFEPLNNVKGDVARIVMYVYTHYNTYENVNGTTNGKGSYFGTLKFTNVISASSESAAISLLLEWNKSDPVDSIETRRNEEVYKIQGNRNPFIDHPEYAEAIWGNGAVTPPGPSVELESLSLNKTALTLQPGRSEKLTVTAYPAGASASVDWTSANTAVATVSASGEVTAKAEGTTIITATSKTNSAIKATAQVTVEKSDETSGVITITTSSFTLSNSYNFQSWSEGGASGIAYIYGANAEYMQFNKSKPSYYLASTTAVPGAIKSVTVKSQEGSIDREWKLLTSNSAYSQVAGKPTNGNDQGTKTVTSDGVTWQVSGTDTFFALTYEYAGTAGVAYLESIVIEYGAEGGGSGEHTSHEWTIWEPDAIGGTHSRHTTCDSHDPIVETKKHDFKNGSCTVCGAVDPDYNHGGEENSKLQAFHAAVEAIVTAGTLQARYTSLQKAAVIYKTLTDEEKFEADLDVGIFLKALLQYNETVRAYNEDAEKANKAATNR